MAKQKKKKKKGRKQLIDNKIPEWQYRAPYEPRVVNANLLKLVENLDWHPRRCFIAYDWEKQRVCLIFPEPIASDNSLWRYTEFDMNSSKHAHLLWGREIETILKKAKKAGRRRRVL